MKIIHKERALTGVAVIFINTPVTQLLLSTEIAKKYFSSEHEVPT